jgi:hypothetical protein
MLTSYQDGQTVFLRDLNHMDRPPRAAILHKEPHYPLIVVDWDGPDLLHQGMEEPLPYKVWTLEYAASGEVEIILLEREVDGHPYYFPHWRIGEDPNSGLPIYDITVSLGEHILMTRDDNEIDDFLRSIL